MAFNNLKDNFAYSKKNFIIALTLGIIILALPLSYRAILNQQQIIKSRATANTQNCDTLIEQSCNSSELDSTENCVLDNTRCVEFKCKKDKVPFCVTDDCPERDRFLENPTYHWVSNRQLENNVCGLSAGTSGSSQCIGTLTFNPASCQNGSGVVNASWIMSEPEGDGYCDAYMVTSDGTAVGHFKEQDKRNCISSATSDIMSVGRIGNGTYSLLVSNGKAECLNKVVNTVTVNCPANTTPPQVPPPPPAVPPAPPPAGGSVPAPAGQCTLSHKTAAPVLTPSCASCIINNARGAVDFIRSIAGNQSCNAEEAANHWCNGGVEGGQRDCDNLRQNTCRNECGGGAPFCQPDATTLTVSPQQARAGETMIFTYGGAGTTWIVEDFGGGVNCSPLRVENGRGLFTCTAGNTAGNFTWFHKWGREYNNPICSKPLTYTITAATTNNAACGTFKINNSTDQATVAVGSQFDVSLIMNNPTGSKTWKTSENYRMGKVDGDWALPDINRNRVSLPTSEIAAGNTATFNFRLTAPNTAGSFPLNLRMVQDGVEFFGATCSKSITVGAAASSPSPSPSPRVSPSPSPQGSPSPGPQACVAGDLNKNGCIDRGFDGGDFQTWLRIVTGQPTGSDAGKGDVFPACIGDGKKDINDFNLWFVEYLNNRNICR